MTMTLFLQAFAMFDDNGDGTITIEEMLGI